MISRSVLYRIHRIRNHCYKVGQKPLLESSPNSTRGLKWFHVSTQHYKNQQTLVEEVTMVPDKKAKSEMAHKVWRDMSVKEILEIFNCSFDSLQLILPHLTENDSLSQNEVLLLSENLKKKCIFIKNPKLHKKVEKKIVFTRQPESKPENLIKRPPVVTVMGHVDHGKTTLLDSLRNTFVVDSEFGGITQHIGAFSVQVKSGEKITFIDTPGHAAFTTMRARGAEVTDLVILVIAADDGIMEQTVESIKIANKANVKMIVAVNKIDKPQAMNIEVIKEKLLHEGIQVEDKGGDVQIIPISALKKINLDLLIEMILLEADVMNLRGDPTGLVEAVVIESKKDVLGCMATILVKRGTLKKGKILVAGNSYARVKCMFDENRKEYTEALPSTPVQVAGWKELPAAGVQVFEVSSEKEARKLVKDNRQNEISLKQEDDLKYIIEKAETLRKQYIENKIKMNSFKTGTERRQYFFKNKLLEHKKEESSTTPVIKLIIKSDVHGSLEVLMEILASYDCHEQCELHLIASSVGKISANDIELSDSFNAIVYGFNTGIDDSVKELVKEKQIDIRLHNVIYKMIDDLKQEITAILPPKDVEKVNGEAIVNQHFWIKVGKKKVAVAGCKCVKGELNKNSLFKVIRNDEVIFDGTVSSMKHFKNEVQHINKNAECGLMFNEFTSEFEPNDKIICYEIEKVPQETSWEPGF